MNEHRLSGGFQWAVRHNIRETLTLSVKSAEDRQQWVELRERVLQTLYLAAEALKEPSTR